MITVWSWTVITKNSAHLASYVKHMAVVIYWVWTDDSCCYKEKSYRVCNIVKPLPFIPTCVFFMQVLLTSGPKWTLYNFIRCLVLKVAFSHISHSEFLVFTNSIPRVIISEKNIAKHGGKLPLTLISIHLWNVAMFQPSVNDDWAAGDGENWL
jgi:hypothetical protein